MMNLLSLSTRIKRHSKTTKNKDYFELLGIQKNLAAMQEAIELKCMRSAKPFLKNTGDRCWLVVGNISFSDKPRKYARLPLGSEWIKVYPM